MFLAVSARGFLLNQPASSASCKPLAEKVGPVSPLSPRTAAAASDLEMAALAASAPRRLGKILPSTTAFFACDVQERFRDLIFNMPAVISTTRYTRSSTPTFGAVMDHVSHATSGRAREKHAGHAMFHHNTPAGGLLGMGCARAYIPCLILPADPPPRRRKVCRLCRLDNLLPFVVKATTMCMSYRSPLTAQVPH